MIRFFFLYWLADLRLWDRDIERITKLKIKITQRGMVRSMLSFAREGKIRADDIRTVTKVNEIFECMDILKWQWVGRIAWRKDDRWMNLVSNRVKEIISGLQDDHQIDGTNSSRGFYPENNCRKLFHLKRTVKDLLIVT